MDAIIVYWVRDTTTKQWSRKIAKDIAAKSAAKSEYTEAIAYLKISNAWRIIQATNKAKEYFTALNSPTQWCTVPEGCKNNWAQRFRSFSDIAKRNNHMKVMQALIENKKLFDKWAKLSIGNLEVKEEILSFLIADVLKEQKKEQEKKEKKENECGVAGHKLPILTIPNCIYSGKDGTVIYNWEDGRVVHVNYDDRDLTGHLVKYPHPLSGADFEEETTGNNQAGREVTVLASEKKVTILMVYLGETSGICTLSVASVMYAVIDQARARAWFPEKGEVYIESVHACAAFNCYNRAFALNGFELVPKKKQLDYIKNNAIPGNTSYGDFRHTLKYQSRKQIRLAKLYETKEKNLKQKKMAKQKLLDANAQLRKARVRSNNMVEKCIKDLKRSREVVEAAESKTKIAMAKYKQYSKKNT
tara:strand:+ start:1717 stop:2964 length:1248 start_codon:yes stop_codon:yes gene_type:complete